MIQQIGKRARGRQTLAFLKTDAGWKIVHEHGGIEQGIWQLP